MKNKILMEELTGKHRKIKAMMLELLGKANSPHITKEKLADMLFKIYLELK